MRGEGRESKRGLKSSPKKHLDSPYDPTERGQRREIGRNQRIGTLLAEPLWREARLQSIEPLLHLPAQTAVEERSEPALRRVF